MPRGVADATLVKGQGQSVKRQQLPRERFGGSHAHLDASSDIEDLIHKADQGVLGAVGNPQEPRCIRRIGHGLATILFHRQGR